EAIEEGVASLAIATPSQLSVMTASIRVDDFIMTPVDEDELRLRLSRLVWEQTGADDANVIQHGPLVIDLERYKVTIDNEVVDLTYKEYELLRFLASNPGK